MILTQRERLLLIWANISVSQIQTGEAFAKLKAEKDPELEKIIEELDEAKYRLEKASAKLVERLNR